MHLFSQTHAPKHILYLHFSGHFCKSGLTETIPQLMKGKCFYGLVEHERSRPLDIDLAVCLYCKIRTSQGTNQKAAFHHARNGMYCRFNRSFAACKSLSSVVSSTKTDELVSSLPSQRSVYRKRYCPWFNNKSISCVWSSWGRQSRQAVW